MAPWISIGQHCLRFFEALLLHGETRPMTNLQPEQPARLPKFGEGMRWGEANRSLWPDSEFHGESLPAVPVLDLIRVQNKSNTQRCGKARGVLRVLSRAVFEPDFRERHDVRKRTAKSVGEQRGVCVANE